MNIASAAGSGPSQIWSGASAPMSPTQKMSGLFDSIDPSGSGSITKSQFEQAFQTQSPPASFQSAGADAVWAKLDPNGTGAVSKQDFVSTMTTLMKELRGHHHHHGSAAGATALSASATALDAVGQPKNSANANSDGSTVGSVLDLLA